MQAAARLDRRWRREAGNGSALRCYLDAEHAAEIFTASDPTARRFVAAFFGVALMGIFPLPQLIKNILDFPEMGRERELLKKARGVVQLLQCGQRGLRRKHAGHPLQRLPVGKLQGRHVESDAFGFGATQKAG